MKNLQWFHTAEWFNGVEGWTDGCNTKKHKVWDDKTNFYSVFSFPLCSSRSRNLISAQYFRVEKLEKLVSDAGHAHSHAGLQTCCSLCLRGGEHARARVHGTACWARALPLHSSLPALCCGHHPLKPLCTLTARGFKPRPWGAPATRTTRGTGQVGTEPDPFRALMCFHVVESCWGANTVCRQSYSWVIRRMK